MSAEEQVVTAQNTGAPTADSSGAATGTWNHQGPVVFSALFDWPPRPVDAFLALTKRWVTVTRNVLFLLFALVVYHWLMPPLQTFAELSWSWVLTIFARNIALMLLVAGGLHVYLFVYRGQGMATKFDKREQLESGKQFLFGKQVWDNMFWSLASGVTIWTAYEVMYLWAAANGAVPLMEFASSPVGFVAWFVLLPLFVATHFFLVHRLLHSPLLYKRFHLLHHRNIHIGPWSGMSMHPVEHIIYISSVLIHFVVPSHPIIFLYHIYLRCLVPAFSHSGFQQLVVKGKTVTESADFHHQLHHRYFECNYGNVDVPLDRWIDAVHDGSKESTRHIVARRRDMYKNRAMPSAQ